MERQQRRRRRQRGREQQRSAPAATAVVHLLLLSLLLLLTFVHPTGATAPAAAFCAPPPSRLHLQRHGSCKEQLLPRRTALRAGPSNDKDDDAAGSGASSSSSSPASFKGFGLLEWANKVVPQKAIVKSARFSWNLLWKVRACVVVRVVVIVVVVRRSGWTGMRACMRVCMSPLIKQQPPIPIHNHDHNHNKHNAQTLMAELAPQSKDGGYVRPNYGFRGQVSTQGGAGVDFPWEAGRYHMCVRTSIYTQYIEARKLSFSSPFPNP
jgi:hypothetical protein